MKDIFRGEVHSKVDQKARVSIPAPFRRVLEAGDPDRSGGRPRLVLVYGDPRNPCAEGFTAAKMDQIVTRIMNAPDDTPNLATVRRIMIQMSVEVEVDDDGRIVLPPRVRDKLGVSTGDLSKGFEATFAGAGDRFTLWKRDSYDAHQESQFARDLERLPGEGDLMALLGAMAIGQPGS